MKRTIPLLISFFSGFILLVAYFGPWMGDLAELALTHFAILAAIAFILGGGNLLRVHGEKIYKQQPGWGYSMIALFAFLATLYVGIFKVGVPTQLGYWTADTMRAGDAFALALVNVQVAPDGETVDRSLNLTVRRAAPNARLPVHIGDDLIGELETNDLGRGDFVWSGDAPGGGLLASVESGTRIRVGDQLSAPLQPYGRITGQYNANGSAFWWLYEYGFQPLVQTTFAMLAFYVASAAFRAFRARNVESVLLLGTAFIILLGRTYLGTLLTSFLADEGFLSFFQIPNLVTWIMSVFNTAGQRAIAIGIALGVASTSLKVLLGLDRSYLGKEG